jgi:hypothetical protein
MSMRPGKFEPFAVHVGSVKQSVGATTTRFSLEAKIGAVYRLTPECREAYGIVFKNITHPNLLSFELNNALEDASHDKNPSNP